MKQRKTQTAPAAGSQHIPAITSIFEVAQETAVDASVKTDQYPNCSRNMTRVKIWMQYYTRQYPQRAACLTLFTTAVLSVLLLQMHAFIFEKQGPLDHASTTLILKPYYARHCPEFSIPDDANQKKVKMDNSFTKKNQVDWSCTSITNDDIQFPRIVMIGARTKEENNTFPKWKDLVWDSVDTSAFVDGTGPHNLPRLQRINTLKVSNEYALNGEVRQQGNTRQETMNITTQVISKNQYLCRGMKWEQRLFAVYQTIFGTLLSSYPEEQDFIIVEDDAILLNTEAFVEEVCQARSHDMQFYSLFRSPLQWQGKSSVSCMFEHGTVAFYIQRPLMETIMNENRRGHFCRFPIDMYISKMGPWYATRREIVGHFDGGRVGSGPRE